MQFYSCFQEQGGSRQNDKHIISSVVNKPTPSVDASETLYTIVKCKNKFYDVWIQFLILFLLVTLIYGHFLFNMDCYYLKANTTVKNLTACLIFIKYHIYNFSYCKTFGNRFAKCDCPN